MDAERQAAYIKRLVELQGGTGQDDYRDRLAQAYRECMGLPDSAPVPAVDHIVREIIAAEYPELPQEQLPPLWPVVKVSPRTRYRR